MHSFPFSLGISPLKKILGFCLAAVILVMLSACDDDDDKIVDDKPSITFITGYVATDDQGYNSLLYQTMTEWDSRPELEVNILVPKCKDVAREMMEKWIGQTRHRSKALLVIASPYYRDLIDEYQVDLQDNQQVIAFEGKAQHQSKNFCSFTFNRNGAAYLAGKMASKCKDIVVIAGEGQEYINTAWKAFQQGLEGQHTFDVSYLSYDNDGFNRPDSAYKVVSEHPDAFVFPLAGKSNLGVYRFLNEVHLPHQLTAAGMDVDFNFKSSRIPFSILLHVDQVMNKYLEMWLQDKELPAYQSWGMRSGMVEIRLNENFIPLLDVKLADYLNFYNKYKAEAMEKEDSFAPRLN